MKIKKVADKPIVIHMKEKAKLHVKSVTRGPKITGIKGKRVEKTTDKGNVVNIVTVQRRKNANPNIDNNKKDKRECIKQAVQKESSLQSQYQKAKKDREAAIGKKSASIKTAGAVGVGAAFKQMEGGDELHESTMLMSSLARQVTTVSLAGRNLYRRQAEKRIKKVNDIKKAVEDTAAIGSKNATKEPLKKPIMETKATAKMTSITKEVTMQKRKNTNPKMYNKKTASDKSESNKDNLHESAMVMSSLAGQVTSTIEAEKSLHRKQTSKKQIEKRIKKVNNTKKIKKRSVNDTAVKSAKSAKRTTTGEAAGRKMNNQDRKKSTRSRMIQLFAAKLRQEDNQDNIAKALKDIVMMRFSIVVKKAAAYAALFLFGLFILAALVALPIIAVIAVIYNSPLAIFFPSLSSGETTQQVLSAYVSEFNRGINTELSQHSGYDWSEKVYVDFEGSGIPDNYYDILAVYMVRYGNGDTATDMKDKAKENLKKVFDDMCSYSISSGTETVTDEEGNETTYSIKQVNVSLKTYHDMIADYGFNAEEVYMLLEIMNPEYLAMLGYTGGGDSGQAAISPEQYRAIVDAVSDANGKKVVEFALSKAGYPYSQDYRDTGSYYDCSSLAYYAFKNAGVDIMYEGANTAASEGKYCYDNSYLVNYDEMQPGDLIFYSYANNGRFMNISHVAVYAGDGMVVEAVNERLGVIYRPVQSRSSIVFIGRPE